MYYHIKSCRIKAAIVVENNSIVGGWVLNGEKAWITNAGVSEVIILYAQTNPAIGWRGIACFLVDGQEEGFERLPPFESIGGHAIGADGFRLNQ